MKQQTRFKLEIGYNDQLDDWSSNNQLVDLAVLLLLTVVTVFITWNKTDKYKYKKNFRNVRMLEKIEMLYWQVLHWQITKIWT